MREISEAEKLIKYKLLNSLNTDFIATASTYAKTIISEYFLEEHEKTAKIAHLGGIAGGRKYLLGGILFKLASGDMKGGPYNNNDEFAAKGNTILLVFAFNNKKN